MRVLNRGRGMSGVPGRVGRIRPFETLEQQPCAGAWFETREREGIRASTHEARSRRESKFIAGGSELATALRHALAVRESELPAGTSRTLLD
ncbi:MAG TPA: hypothetical protein VMS45_08660, partial [Gemmatimonadaceae bacterium]|nr:hypothetical protein [Gemmatimonadaceae bacterium]